MMKYEESIDLIKQKSQWIQHDINDNPLKYIKNNIIDKNSICSNLSSEIKKISASGWIDQSEIENAIQNKKIKLQINKKKKNITYKLIDKKGKELIFENEINLLYFIKDNELIIIIMFPLHGSLLDFDYLFSDIEFNIVIKLDISNLKILLKLTNNDIEFYNDTKFNILKL